ncbi:hypothetical protein OKA04_22245 [Luteolibacter flavescens]|uniref:Tetratricopeptide repeat protein n=1 Tax=Luteolibacter flavescens TaxID=1859460 RepID=A0ABT3FV57_9BACT|nr:hypothetical protein [Luteolibacter flavescens]MCW1887473.1 hypothetical protein [Luteolibacter flavescens]
MRHLLLIAALACPLVASGQGNFAQEFHNARKIESTDIAAASEGMTRSFHKAIEAGNADYATAAGASACELIYRQGKNVEAGKLAREVIDALDAFPVEGFQGDAVRRCTIFGYLERGLMMEGKIGAALQANRAGAETLRGKKLRSDGNGAPITVSEVIVLPAGLRSVGWRLIEREANLLDHIGRTAEARALLDEAAAHLGQQGRKLAPVEHFYASKLLATRADLLDFLGYEEEAIRLQRELLASGLMDKKSGPLKPILQLNLLRNLSQWEGPSEEILAEAKQAAADAKQAGGGRGTERLVAKMELDLKESKAALEAMREGAAFEKSIGHLHDALYADRDYLVSRANAGDEGLDAEFTGLLERMRAQGNKRGEPTLYREYGNYLLERDRPMEAVAMFTEALRLTRSFGWVLHEPSLLSKLFKARFEAGDLAGARAVLAEFDAFLAKHSDIPAARRVLAETGRAVALARLGEMDAAKAALASARKLATDLPDHRKEWLTPEMEARLMKLTSPTPATVAQLQPLTVQPLEITSIAAPGKSARTRFTVFNSNPTGVKGSLVISGPGAAIAGDDVRFEAGKPVSQVRIARSISSGGDVSITAIMASGKGAAAVASVAWDHADQKPGAATLWNVSWDEAATGSVVLDASALATSPFRSVVLFHELAAPAHEADGISFRLVSKVPLRFEYYDPRSQSLLGVDANGNGDFTEKGDLYFQGSTGAAAALVPAGPGDKPLGVEIRIFAIDGSPAASEAEPLILAAEVFRDGEWRMEAENTLE